MRALRLLALAAALVAPAAAAHAQVSVYVGPAHRFVAPAYRQGWVPARYGYGPAVQYAVPVQPVWGGYDGWRAHRYWAEHRGYYGRGWGHDRRW